MVCYLSSLSGTCGYMRWWVRIPRGWSSLDSRARPMIVISTTAVIIMDLGGYELLHSLCIIFTWDTGVMTEIIRGTIWIATMELCGMNYLLCVHECLFPGGEVTSLSLSLRQSSALAQPGDYWPQRVWRILNVDKVESKSRIAQLAKERGSVDSTPWCI